MQIENDIIYCSEKLVCKTSETTKIFPVLDIKLLYKLEYKLLQIA